MSPNKRTRHHLTARCRNDRKAREEKQLRKRRNIMVLKHERHRAWHQLFGVQTLKEIIERIDDYIIADWLSWKRLFGNKPKEQAKAVLERLDQFKTA